MHATAQVAGLHFALAYDQRLVGAPFWLYIRPASNRSQPCCSLARPQRPIYLTKAKIVIARRIAVATHTDFWQSIWFAFAIKAAVLTLGAGGLATMRDAIFAGVGIALFAILGAMRIQRLDFASKP